MSACKKRAGRARQALGAFGLELAPAYRKTSAVTPEVTQLLDVDPYRRLTLGLP